MEKTFEKSELIINPDGSIFHLHLLPEHIADNVILVGDPDRVEMISGYFKEIKCRVRNREFFTITGSYRDKWMTVISTGIGADNIDIVLNELDALVNINLNTRRVKAEKRELTILRIGTSGAIQANLPPGTYLASKFAVGFDGLLNYYDGRDKVSYPDIEKAFIDHTGWNKRLPAPYFCKSDTAMLNAFKDIASIGITVSANGFYAPQGRELRATLAFPDLNQRMMDFDYEGLRITNFEMEGSAIYGLSGILGHRALTVCLIIANRAAGKFLQDYKPHMKKLVKESLEILYDFSVPK